MNTTQTAKLKRIENPDVEEIVKVIDILLVEDNMGDVRLTIEALKRSKVPHNLHIVRDGVEAIAFLNRRGEHTYEVRPDLILLDLNLPKKNGREVLEEIKKDESLRQIPVMILTTSKAESDIANAYDLNANCYIVKPIGFKQFSEVVKCIANFWFTTATLPPKK